MSNRVLIIDDTQEILEEIDEILSMEGFDVVTAINGYEAAKALEHNNIDLVITDLVMNEMSGYQVISLIKTLNSNIPIIVLSGQVANEDIRKALRLEADLYLKKPCSADDLVQAVKKLIK